MEHNTEPVCTAAREMQCEGVYSNQRPSAMEIHESQEEKQPVIHLSLFRLYTAAKLLRVQCVPQQGYTCLQEAFVIVNVIKRYTSLRGNRRTSITWQEVGIRI